MWPIAYLLTAFVCLGASTDPRGPTSPEDEAFQWQSAETALRNEDFAQAEMFLNQLVSRYPASQHARQATFELGRARVILKKPSLARQDFRRFLGQVAPTSPEARRAKAWLVRVAWMEGQWDQSLALTHEILRADADDLETFLLKSKTFHHMKRHAEAQEWWMAFQNKLRGHEDGRIPLLVEAAAFEWELKAMSCPLFPRGTRKLDEAAIRAHMKEQALCLEEGLVLLRKMFHQATLGLPEGSVVWSQSWFDDGVRRWSTAYQKFWAVCLNPMRPADLARGTKALRAFSDFRDRLTQECTDLQKRTAETVEGWKPKHPAHLQVQLNRLLESIRKGKVAL